jgi:hypothetical protein
MIFVIRFTQRFAALGLAVLLTSGVWCGGLAADTSAMLVEMGSKTVTECAQHDMPSESQSSQGSRVPCVFRSLDLMSQGASPSVQADNIFNYGHFVPLSLSEQTALAAHFRVVRQSLAAKNLPHLFYSVLNL